jgi:hypothetical protein
LTDAKLRDAVTRSFGKSCIVILPPSTAIELRQQWHLWTRQCHWKSSSASILFVLPGVQRPWTSKYGLFYPFNQVMGEAPPGNEADWQWVFA